MGRLPGLGGAPYGSSVGPGIGAGAGSTPATGGTQREMPTAPAMPSAAPFGPNALGPVGAAGAAPLTGGTVSRGALKSRLEGLIKGTSLEGFVPPEGGRFGITTGAPHEWAHFMTELAGRESSFKAGTIGDVGKFGGARLIELVD